MDEYIIEELEKKLKAEIKQMEFDCPDLSWEEIYQSIAEEFEQNILYNENEISLLFIFNCILISKFVSMKRVSNMTRKCLDSAKSMKS